MEVPSKRCDRNLVKEITLKGYTCDMVGGHQQARCKNVRLTFLLNCSHRAILLIDSSASYRRLPPSEVAARIHVLDKAVIRTRLRKTIEQELAEDPYAQKVFGELLKQAIAEAEAMFDHPLKQYALFQTFEQQLESRITPGLPDVLADKPHAKAYFGAIRLVLGDETFAALSSEAVDSLVQQALAMDTVVRDAVAENSLNPQNIEAAIRKGLLPLLFGTLGLDNAKQVVEQVIQITRVGLSKS